MESEENAAAFPSDPTGAATGDDLSYTTWADATEVGGAASFVLVEVTSTGEVEVSCTGTDLPWCALTIPRPGTYFAEIADARGNRYRTQTVAVDRGFFELAAARGVEEREKTEARSQKREPALGVAAPEYAPPRRVGAPLANRVGWMTVGALAMLLVMFVVAFVRRFL